MNAFLKRLFRWFLLGVALCAGLVITMNFADNFGMISGTSNVFINSPSGIEIIESRIIPEAEYVTIVGKVDIDTNFSWSEIYIAADVLINGKLADKVQTLFRANGKERQSFLVRSYDLKYEKISAPVSYEVSVTKALLPRKQLNKFKTKYESDI
ncbi:hypothetical protein GF406_12570 [candidate division KSB1 bacterium]|nr:hypothetical protein [candidate division KSB1 bacterium]